MNKQFLTVYAILDDHTQDILQAWRAELRNAGIVGTQPDIPFHISLGSYPPDCAGELISAIRTAAKEIAAFPVDLLQLNDFGKQVLFAEPEISPDILRLRERFCNDYPTAHPYHPHCTILQGTAEQVTRAHKILLPRFSPIHAQIAALELGKFFPAELLYRMPLTTNGG